MTQQLWVPGPLPGLNEVVEAAKGTGSSIGRKQARDLAMDRVLWRQPRKIFHRQDGYVTMKRDLTTLVKNLAVRARLKPMEAAHFLYAFRERNKKRDKSNIFTAVKFIEDGLVAAKVIENDGWKQILSISMDFQVASAPGIMVFMTDDDNELFGLV